MLFSSSFSSCFSSSMGWHVFEGARRIFWNFTFLLFDLKMWVHAIEEYFCRVVALLVCDEECYMASNRVQHFTSLGTHKYWSFLIFAKSTFLFASEISIR